MFTHVPKDGKTPVYNPTSKTWAYVESPSATELTSSAERFNSVDDTATKAKTKADNAQTLAESKVTAEEAVEEARSNMFVITPLPKNGSIPLMSFHTIEFLETSPGAWTVWINLEGAGPASSSTRGWLDYAGNDTVNDLITRVAAIEKKLGIS